MANKIVSVLVIIIFSILLGDAIEESDNLWIVLNSLIILANTIMVLSKNGK